MSRLERSAAAALVALIVMMPGDPAGGVAGFGDVGAGRFYTAAVQWMVDNDITTGTSPTCFSPDDQVTRGQTAAFIWRMEGRPGGSPPHPFDDVSAPWQQEPVDWMAANGITTGTSPTTFSPDDLLTRGQLAALLHRLAGSPPAPASAFTDVVKAWQIVPVGWMAGTGITTGTSPTTFSPDDPASRGQLATFLHRYEGSPVVAIDPASPYCPPVGGPSGAETFETNCAACHGVDGSGGFGPSLVATPLTEADLVAVIETGRGNMPSFDVTLSPGEIEEVARYVKTL